MNDSWGFNLTDHNYKSVRDLIPLSGKGRGAGANLLPQHRAASRRHDPAGGRSAAAGAGRVDDDVWWLDLWDARRPDCPRSWGVTTQRGDTVFVHVLDWSDPVLACRRCLGAGRLGCGPAARQSRSQDRASQSRGVVRNPIADRADAALSYEAFCCASF